MSTGLSGLQGSLLRSHVCNWRLICCPSLERMKAVHEKGVPVRKCHDVGSDRYRSRAPKQFIKRSRWTTRIGLKRIRTLRRGIAIFHGSERGIARRQVLHGKSRKK